MTAHAVREALQGGPSREAQLRTLADEARSQLWGFFQVSCTRSAHACRGDMQALEPNQRRTCVSIAAMAAPRRA